MQLWCSAAVGACAGAHQPAQAVLLTILVLTANTLLQPLVHRINRIPLTGHASEANYEISVMTTVEAAALARKQLMAALQAAHYPVGDVELIDRPDGLTEVLATLISTAVEPKELDAVVAKLEAAPEISSATWSSTTED